MNRDLVDRALHAAGEWRLSEEDAAARNTNYELCRTFYLQTYLEALTEVEWTGALKRARLMRTGRPFGFRSPYRFAYDLPDDCAKAAALDGWAQFSIEGRLLLTDAERAELSYVGNGRVLRRANAFDAGSPDGLAALAAAETYLSGGSPGDAPDETVWAGRPADLAGYPTDEEGNVEDPDLSGEDYPDYRDIGAEPYFWRYVELMLAAKFAMKMSNDPQLHQLLLQEAMAIGNHAMETSRANRASPVPTEPTWAERVLGRRDANHELRVRRTR
jgi:hypothetical protein